MTPRPEAKPVIRLLIYVPPEIYEWVKDRADDLGVSKNAVVVKALDQLRRFDVEVEEAK